MIYILDRKYDGGIIAAYSTKGKALDEQIRRHNEDLHIYPLELDPPPSPIDKDFVIGKVYEASIDKETGEIDEVITESYYRHPIENVVEDKNHCINVKCPLSETHLRASLINAREIFLKDNLNYIDNRKKSYRAWLEKERDNLVDYPNINNIQIGHIYEEFIDGEWKSCELRTKGGIQTAYDKIMKSPGHNTKRIRCDDIIIVSN